MSGHNLPICRKCRRRIPAAAAHRCPWCLTPVRGEAAKPRSPGKRGKAAPGKALTALAATLRERRPKQASPDAPSAVQPHAD